ncbi:MAG: amidohydrolase [Clostridiales bacterium]|nr:amidohydrolase [Clostridiales bacterium]
MLDTLIKNATVIPMTGEGEVYYGCSVGIKDGAIEFIGDGHPEASEVIDARGDIVMPGLVNAHAHTAMCVMRGYADDYALQSWLYDKVFPVEARLTERAIDAGARLGMAEMIRTGTTSFSDMYFCQPAVAKAVDKIGMRANLCNAVLALGDDYVFEKDRAVIETDELLKEYGVKGRIRADVSIHAEYTSRPEIWKRVHEWAKEYGAVTHIHLSETKREQEEAKARHGLSPAAAFDKYGIFDTKTLAAHGVWLEKSDMELLAKRGVSIAHCPVSNLKLGSGTADVAAMVRAGVNVCLGTDGACSNNSLDLFEELKLAALLAKGRSLDPTALPAYEALKMATVNGAKGQGREGETGVIEEGYRADLIMIDASSPHMRPIYDPISSVVYSARGSDVRMTMVDGKVLYLDGEYKTVDVKEAIREVEEAAVPIVLNE